MSTEKPFPPNRSHQYSFARLIEKMLQNMRKIAPFLNIDDDPKSDSNIQRNNMHKSLKNDLEKRLSLPDQSEYEINSLKRCIAMVNRELNEYEQKLSIKTEDIDEEPKDTEPKDNIRTASNIDGDTRGDEKRSIDNEPSCTVDSALQDLRRQHQYQQESLSRLQQRQEDNLRLQFEQNEENLLRERQQREQTMKQRQKIEWNNLEQELMQLQESLERKHRRQLHLLETHQLEQRQELDYHHMQRLQVLEQYKHQMLQLQDQYKDQVRQQLRQHHQQQRQLVIDHSEQQRQQHLEIVENCKGILDRLVHTIHTSKSKASKRRSDDDSQCLCRPCKRSKIDDVLE